VTLTQLKDDLEGSKKQMSSLTEALAKLKLAESEVASLQVDLGEIITKEITNHTPLPKNVSYNSALLKDFASTYQKIGNTILP